MAPQHPGWLLCAAITLLCAAETMASPSQLFHSEIQIPIKETMASPSQLFHSEIQIPIKETMASPSQQFPSEIQIPIKEIVSLKKCQVCSSWGKYHYYTFDGNLFQLKSNCTFLLTASCSTSNHEAFSVQIHRSQGAGGQPLITWVKLTLDGVTVELTLHGMLIDGKPCKLPMSHAGVHVEKIQAYIKVKARLGLTVLWCPDSILVELDSKYQGQTDGLCGDFNGVALNEFFKNGVKMSLQEFANLWRMDNPNDFCPESQPEPTPPSCNHVRPVCLSLLYSPAFKGCHALLDVESFVTACCEDACQCGTDSTGLTHSDCLCDTLSEFSRQCVRKGGYPGIWRTQTLCWKRCPLNMEYQECCNPTMNTCSNPYAGSTSNEPCVDGCVCPDGTVLDDLTGKGCIPVDQCSCSYKGNLFAPGKGYTNKCSKCVCESGQWTCTESNCAGTCSLLGGAHINTFDGKAYTFHGDCTYTLTNHCIDDKFVVQVDLRPCGLSGTETCLKEVLVALNGGVHILAIKPCGDVLVNSVSVKLPYSAVGVNIMQPTSFYILVQTSMDFLLVVQLKPIMQLYVIAENRHMKHMCGLCGNFNGNQADDFMKQSGVEEATGTGFANSWKTCASCISVWPVYQDPCSLSKEKEEYAQKWCSLLTDKEGVFKPCHSTICPQLYKQRCMYDSCSCKQREDYMCAAISSYVYACAAEGIQITGWRDVACGKYTNSCPSGMVYSNSINSCPATCRCKFSSDSCCHLIFDPVDGCVCAPGTYKDESGNCVPHKNCPCFHQNQVVPAGQTVHLDSGVCTCKDGILSCVGHPLYFETPLKCSPPMVYYNCSEHGLAGKGKECEKSCSTLDTPCVCSGCISGCMCPPGLISDDNKGCIKPKACPCIHNGQKFSPGQSIKVDCNTCTCKDRKWECTLKQCDSTCKVYGSGHYKTFDHHRYTFDGSCEYILVQDYCDGSKGSFRVLVQNVPCGKTGIKISMTIKIFLQGSELILTEGSYELKGSANPFHISTVGLYLTVQINNGLILIWNRKTILFIKLSQIHKGRVCGLCGNFDGNSNNDLTARCGALVVNPLVFANSWKDNPDCPDVPTLPDLCKANPYKQPWARKQCNAIHDLVFSECHLSVDPTPYYEACLFDTCSCDSEGECEPLCTAVAAYAEACNQAGVCVEWRTSKFCPIFCDLLNPPEVCEWHYKPCGVPCVKTCQNPSGLCSTEIPPLEGCYPKCPPHKPYFDEVAKICVVKEKCGCYDSEGKHYNNGDIVPTSQNCVVCKCESSHIQCHYSAKACRCIYEGVSYPFGAVVYNNNDGHGNCFNAVCGFNGTIHHNLFPCPEPATPCHTTTPPTTPCHTTTSATTPCHITPSNDCAGDGDCEWSRWFNHSLPKPGFSGGEVESIKDILYALFPICSSPVAIECRAAWYPALSLAQVGQKVICDKNVGLVCRNIDQGKEEDCFDYEIRVRCKTGPTTSTTTTPCHTTTTPCHTTTTPCHTTTTPCHDTSSTTTPCNDKPTTDCTGKENCVWSPWYNLGSPSEGPFGEEVESIHNILIAGFPICSSPVAVECRAALNPSVPFYQLGQHVTCDILGLVCKNSKQGYWQKCLDYEIRVKCCECQSTPTTATTPCDHTSSTTTSTTPCDLTPSTTDCIAEINCVWSQWYNFGYPSDGPYGDEVESIQDIITAGFPICSSPAAVECRPVKKPGQYHIKVAQRVTCDTDVGLVCKNYYKGYLQQCLDYEIRVKCCNCPSAPTTSTATTPCHPTPPPTPCHCIHQGVAHLPGSILYNYTDSFGYCFIGYCTQTCHVHVSHYQCAIPTPPPKDCLDLTPPRKNGETWKKSGCRTATCKDGEVIISSHLCAIPEPIVCANNFPPVKVFDEDGCCFHYECECICQGWGDPHYLTFDGTYYSFQGSCSYWLVKEVFPLYGFNVMLSNSDCGEFYSTCIQSITVFYNYNKIHITHHTINGVLTYLIFVNDKSVTCAFLNSDFWITTTGISTVLLIPKIKAEIIFSVRSFIIKLPISLFGGHTQGQCGRCNNNRGDDCIAPATQTPCDCQDMAHEWHTNDGHCQPPVHPPPHPIHPDCDTTVCDIMKSSVFEDCHGVVDFNAFYTACIHDVSNSNDPHKGCQSLQMYAVSCAQAGVCIEWRCNSNGLCDHTCPSPKVYHACGPAVEPTCDSWFNHKFINSKNDFTAMVSDQRFEGCFCPSGTTLLSAHSNECVPSCEICRLPNGKWKKANDQWISGCELCRCDEDTLQVVCVQKLCPPRPYIYCSHPGQVLVTDTVECCPRVRCECDKTKCNSLIPSCPIGMKLNTTVGVCCDKYECVPKCVCVFNNREYEVGDVVPRTPCERCVCSEKKDPVTSLHLLDCVSLVCDTHCPPGHEYRVNPGQCCGSCVQICCVVSLPGISHDLQPGEVWSPPGNNCVKFECVLVGKQFLIVEAKTMCPPFDPKDCIPGTETIGTDGCCKVCIPRGHPCTVSSSMVILESQGCKSMVPVNMTSCRGACGTFTVFSSRIQSLQRSCSCCQEVSSSERHIKLWCPDHSQISFSYTHIEDCACLKSTCPVLAETSPIKKPHFRHKRR